MRVVCISDTHRQHRNLDLPEGDLLIHAGDMTYTGELLWLRDFAYWFANQPHPHKIVIAGNHDLSLQKNPELADLVFPHSGLVDYLNEEAITVEGFKVFGTPWSPAFNDWAFNAERGEEIRAHWELIPDNTDILVVHGPPYGLGDQCEDGRLVGCVDLLARIEEIQPRLVVCGHVHEGYGTYQTPKGVPIVNASVLDHRYRLVNAPIVMEVESDARRGDAGS